MCAEGGLRTWERGNEFWRSENNRGISAKNGSLPVEVPFSHVQSARPAHLHTRTGGLASFTPAAPLTWTGGFGGRGGCERVQCPGPGHPGPPMMSAL